MLFLATERFDAPLPVLAVHASYGLALEVRFDRLELRMRVMIGGTRHYCDGKGETSQSGMG